LYSFSLIISFFFKADDDLYLFSLELDLLDTKSVTFILFDEKNEDVAIRDSDNQVAVIGNKVLKLTILFIDILVVDSPYVRIFDVLGGAQDILSLESFYCLSFFFFF